jgi:hypothetical protein
MAAVTQTPKRDFADVLPPGYEDAVARARASAGGAAAVEPWQHKFPVTAHWLGRRRGRQWAWYVAIPFGDGHHLPDAMPLPGSYVEASGRAWTEGGARRAITRAAGRAMFDAAGARPSTWRDRALDVLILIALGTLCLGSATIVTALGGMSPWWLPAALVATAAVTSALVVFLERPGRRARARHD